MIHRLSTVVCAAAVLAGCASQGAPGSSAESPPLAPYARESSSGTTLLYVANPGESAVGIYTYANGYPGKQIATISIPDPTGVCTDRAGAAYVVSYSGHRVSEFAHGQTSPVHSLRFTAYPYACAVDQANGNLAVSVQTPHGNYFRGADVQVFAGGQGRPRKYNAEDGFATVYFMAYDDKHDLFATGEPCNETSYCNYGSNGGPPGLFELASGGEYFDELTLQSTTLREPTGLAWIKPTLLVTDDNYQKQGVSTGLKVFVTSSQATVVGTIPFGQTTMAQGVAVRAGVAIVADAKGQAIRTYSIANGALISTLEDKNAQPLAVAISQAN